MRDGQVGLTWLGQSGFILRFPATRILVDAFLSDHPERRFPAPFAPSAAAGFDVLACTHDHLDHLDRDALPAMAEASPHARIVVPESCAGVVVKLGIAESRVSGVRPDESIEVGGVTVHGVPARHGNLPSDAYTFGDGAFLGYVFSAGGAAVYHAGDTIDYDGLAGKIRALSADVVLLPINGRDAEREARDIVGNLDADEAARVAVESGARVAIPMHYDMFAGNPGHPDRFVAAVQQNQSDVAVIIPARGQELLLIAREA